MKYSCEYIPFWIYIRFIIMTIVISQAHSTINSDQQNVVQSASGRARGTPSEWGAWGAWGACSRSCGGGVAVQERSCLPTHWTRLRMRRRRRQEQLTSANKIKTKNCHGLSHRYHECNTAPCPEGETDYRAEQCAQYDRRPFKGHFYTWVPFVDGNAPCTLHCRPRGRAFYAALATAADGTPCTLPPHRAVCVRGHCKVVGSEGFFTAVPPPETRCGRRHVSGLFSRRTLPLGYSLITTVPAGACRLNVTELEPSNNYIALRVSEGAFVVNGAFAVSASGAYEAAGARFIYRRGARDSILAAGPLLQPVDIMILYQHPNLSIKYEYFINTNSDKMDNSLSDSTNGSSEGKSFDKKIFTRHRHHPYEIGEGLLYPNEKQTEIHHFNDKSKFSFDKNLYNVAPMDQNINASESKINMTDKRFSWKMVGFTPCSRTCGGGVQYGRFKCMEIEMEREAGIEACGAAPNARRRRCGRAACGPRWRSGLWSVCPICGPANRTRPVECVNGNRRVNESQCIRSKPISSEICNISNCKDSSEGGQKSRQKNEQQPKAFLKSQSTDRALSDNKNDQQPIASVKSQSTDRALSDSFVAAPTSHSYLNDSFVAEDHEEITNQVTNYFSNEGQRGWLSTEWSQCTSRCGSGVQTRTLRCSEKTGCGARPTDSRPCIDYSNCTKTHAEWFTGAWSVCSSACGDSARRSREVLCIERSGSLRILSAAACAAVPRPATEERCRLSPCGPQWFVGNWTSCAGSCGAGERRRAVRCALESDEIGDFDCAARKPESRSSCIPNQCQSHVTSQETVDNRKGKADIQNDQIAENCSDRLPSCRLAMQARLCRYKYYKQYCCKSCYSARTAVVL